MHVTTAVFSEMWSSIVYSKPMSEAVERSLPNLAASLEEAAPARSRHWAAGGLGSRHQSTSGVV